MFDRNYGSTHTFLLIFRVALLVWGGLATGTGWAKAPPVSSEKTAARRASLMEFQESVSPLLKKHCFACHGSETREKELDLSQLDPNMESTSAARWAMVLDQVVMGEMPPEGELGLNEKDRERFVTWIKGEMKRTGKHLARRQEYANGNKVPHELLFDPKRSGPVDVPTRVRRLSPQIYDSFVQEVGKRATGISQPFSPDANTTFEDMGTPKIDEPTTQTLLKNALRIVADQTSHKIENGEVVKVGSAQKEFLRLFDEKNPATDEEVKRAIEIQFDRVLRREPTGEELERFLALYQKNLKDAGRETGVTYTLAAVFLLPGAVFRWEIGDAQADQDGRVRLAPREIAFALAFALTDKPRKLAFGRSGQRRARHETRRGRRRPQNARQSQVGQAAHPPVLPRVFSVRSGGGNLQRQKRLRRPRSADARRRHRPACGVHSGRG